jgi:hypothetical protein
MSLHSKNAWEESVSRSKTKRRSNRSAKIIMSLFSIIVIVSFVASLVGPSAFRSSDEPTPLPTRVYSTVPPVASPIPSATATPTLGVPTPVLVTPTTGP